MNDNDFSRKAFEEALKATIGTIEKNVSDDEFESYKQLIAKNSGAILDAVKFKVETQDKVDLGLFATTIVLTGNKEAFIALVANVMMLCFHIGWNARNENITPRK